MINTQEIQNKIPYSIVRECEELVKASSFKIDLRELLETLYKDPKTLQA